MCTHHWILGPIKNGKSLGMCKLCDVTKEFEAIWPPRDGLHKRTNYPKPKMSRIDKDVGAMFADLPRSKCL